jgi:hypothetical protein
VQSESLVDGDLPEGTYHYYIIALDPDDTYAGGADKVSNLLANGGFELGSGANANGWDKFTWSGSATFDYETCNRQYAGNRSAHLTTLNAHDGAHRQFPAGLNPADTYLLHGYVKTRNVSSSAQHQATFTLATLGYHLDAGDSTGTTYSTGNPGTTLNGFNSCSATGKQHGHYLYKSVALDNVTGDPVLYCGTNWGTMSGEDAWFDNVRLDRLVSATAGPPGGAPAVFSVALSADPLVANDLTQYGVTLEAADGDVLGFVCRAPECARRWIAERYSAARSAPRWGCLCSIPC